MVENRGKKKLYTLAGKSQIIDGITYCNPEGNGGRYFST